MSAEGEEAATTAAEEAPPAGKKWK